MYSLLLEKKAGRDRVLAAAWGTGILHGANYGGAAGELPCGHVFLILSFYPNLDLPLWSQRSAFMVASTADAALARASAPLPGHDLRPGRGLRDRNRKQRRWSRSRELRRCYIV